MAANYVLLERIELNASAASVTFSNIPQSGYTDLKLVYSARTTTGGNDDEALISFNGSSTGFSQRNVYGTGSAAVSGTTPNQFAGSVNATGSTANVFSNIEVYIPNYTSSNYKSYSIDSVAENNATAIVMRLAAGLWSNTAAITSVTLTLGFAQYSTFSLYGLAATGTTPAIAPKASGGNITTDGTYWYHTFLATGLFTPSTNLTCDYLVIAGGGSGSGGSSGGGGGAGGYLSSVGSSGGGGSAGSSLALTANSSYITVIGAGGSGANFGANAGSNTTFSGLTALGGGPGGTAGTFGSGGGANSGGGPSNSYFYGTGTSGQGYNGGDKYQGTYYPGGGGGGAGSAGGNASDQQGGAGGIGKNTLSSWLSATGTGSSGYIAAGGGGGGQTGGTAGSGGSGGGGAGSMTSNGANGVSNTGSGGGGCGFLSGTGYNGGNGGSGIVIIRYAV
jgi:hypothetical protein